MIDSPYFEMFQNDSIDKQLRIEFDGGVITNEELHSQQFELTESLCSESELRFGSCEASSIKFKISNVFTPLKDKWLTVSMTLNGNDAEPFLIGKYKVYSDVPTADRRFRDVVAYDAMYDIINVDVADWYNTILPNKDSAVSLKTFRTSFISHFGLEQEEIELINDDMPVFKTIEPSEISGKDVITAICEINGCFGHIGRDGKFRYIYLEQGIQGLYPSNDLFPDHAPDYLPQAKTGHLYPQDPKSTRIGKGTYISCQYEDFLVKTINKVQIRQEENDIGAISGDGDNCYIIEDNFLVYGMNASNLMRIADKVRMKISGIIYRPFEADVKGNPCFEVGDAVRLPTRYEIVESYILKRTLKGIQALRDDCSADGAEEYSEKVNSLHKSIIQLKGKANILTRTIDETKSELIDADNQLSSTITQTASQIRMEVQNTKEGLESSITQTAGEIRAEVQNTKEGLESSITQTAEQIKLTVAKAEDTWDTTGYIITISSYGAPNKDIYPPDQYSGKYYLDQETGYLYLSNGSVWNRKDEPLPKKTAQLQSSITQTAGEIRQEVSNTYETKSDAGNTKAELQASISTTAENIQLEVSKKYTTKEDTKSLQTSFDITAAGITSTVSKKVGKDEVVSSINQTAEEITIDAGKINLNGAVTANNNVKISTDGKITAKNATIEGTIESKNATITGGTIHISANEEANNIIELGRSDTKVQMGTDGLRSIATNIGTRTAEFGYSHIGITNETAAGTVIAKMTDEGKGISSYGWESYSDERLKHDIEPMDIHERAQFIYTQEPVRYKYNYDSDGHYRHGLIAQKSQETIGDEDWALCGENAGEDGKKYLTLNYLELIADLIATVQSQNERIKALEGKLNE